MQALILKLDEPVSRLLQPLCQGLPRRRVRLPSPLLDLVESGDGRDQGGKEWYEPQSSVIIMNSVY